MKLEAEGKAYQPAPLPPEDVAAAFPGRMNDPAGASARLKNVLDPSAPNQVYAAKLTEHIHERLAALSSLGYSGLLVGLSGGLDSLIAAKLAQDVIGDQACALTVAIGSDGEGASIAGIQRAAESLGIRHEVLDAVALKAALARTCPGDGPWVGINLDTRVIQTVLFQWADVRGYAVMATTDRSELLLGRYTEHFYGHIAPLSALYKVEAYRLAEQLRVSHLISDPRPGCREHWYDDTIFGAGYDVVDPVLHLMVDWGLRPQDIEERYLPGERMWLERVARRIAGQPARTQPWLSPPPMPMRARARPGMAHGGPVA